MTNKEEFLDIFEKNITRQGASDLRKWLEDSDFFSAPASKSHHSNFEEGLCLHKLATYKELVFLCDRYCPGKYNSETIAISALLHDLCKVNFYVKGTKNVKEEGKWVAKEVWNINEKIPLGHGEKSCIIIQQFMKLQIDELLAIRFHMGGFDSSVKGGDYSMSKAQEMSPLVTLLQLADMLASHLIERKE